MKLYEFDGYIQSIYLVEYEHGLMLLDGASRADVQRICNFITDQLNRPVTDLKLVISTHMHPDHAGAATKLKQLTGCQIATGATNKHWYTGLDGVLMYVTDMALAQWVAGRKGKKKQNLWYPRKLEADIYLQDGQQIPGFEQWQAISTHGHTDRDISLYHQATKQVYVADLIVIVKGEYAPPFPVFHPNRYKQSLQKIKDLNADKILIAHGSEQQLSEQEWQRLMAKAPNKPTTHWRSVKRKLSKALSS